MNTALTVHEVEIGKQEDLYQVKIALEDGLINVDGGLQPITKGYAFYWNSNENEIILVGDDIVPNERWILLSNNGYGESVKANNASDVITAISNSSNLKPSNISLEADAIFENKVVIENGNVATINLNGHKLEAKNMDGTLESFIEIKDGASLTIEGNGETISYTSANAENELFINYGNLTLSNININSDSDMLKLEDVGSATKIENCELTAENDFCYAVFTNSSKTVCDGARVHIEHSTLKATRGYALSFTTNSKLISKDSKFIGNGDYGLSDFGAINLKDGICVFENCEFVSNNFAIEFSDGQGEGYSGHITSSLNNSKYFIGETVHENNLFYNVWKGTDFKFSCNTPYSNLE